MKNIAPADWMLKLISLSFLFICLVCPNIAKYENIHIHLYDNDDKSDRINFFSAESTSGMSIMPGNKAETKGIMWSVNQMNVSHHHF